MEFKVDNTARQGYTTVQLTMTTPNMFWFSQLVFFTVGELLSLGHFAYAAASGVYLYMSLSQTPIPTMTRADPLDKFMQYFAGVLGVGAAVSYVGFGFYGTLILCGLWGAAWMKSPSRTFPTGEEVTKDCDLSGKTVLITGPTSGIGKETARVLCLRGAHVVLASRSVAKLENTRADLEKEIPNAKLSIVPVNLGDQNTIYECVKKLEEMEISKIDILINNAGIMAFPQRKSSAQGLEMQVGVNHVGHFLLTSLLTPLLKKAAPSRVVCVSSLANHYNDDKFYKDPKLETEPYHKWVAYGNSKIANVLFAEEYNNKFSGDGVTAFSVHPGGIFTGLQGDVATSKMFKWMAIASFFFKSIPQGCATTLFCATAKEIEKDGGKYYSDCKVSNKVGRTSEGAAKMLWENTEKLIAESARQTPAKTPT